MSVLIVTSLGDIVVDLHTDRCPLTTKNFLKLCKMKYYNGCLFHKVEKDFTAQTGDRTGIGSGGDSLYKFLYGDQARFFDDEIHPELKHNKIGTVSMASAGKNLNASQFYFTLRDDLDYLDGKHTVFGVVEEQEGLDTLAKINEVFVDDKGRPYKNIRIKHTYILDDPFSDPPQLVDFIPEKSPEGKPGDEIAEERLEDNWVPLDETLGPAEMEELIRSKEAHTNAAILESIGDIPDAEIKPPENVLFVCKLNPVTQDEDLHTIFSRFGNVVSADIIRDYKTGDSLCYAFIEFETKEACELAYFKMDNTLIDDRRIHVDFSQSVSKLWNQYRHGKRTEKKGNGCFKCGAPDHIARDCNQGTKGLDNASKYVLKEDNKQRGDGRLSYDMLFDEDDTGSLAHDHDDETGTKVKKQKLDDRRSEDSRQRGYNDRVSDSRSYRNWHGDDGRAHRGVDSRHGDRRQDGHQRAEVSRRRDVDRQEREREMQKHHDSGRHGRGGLDIRKRSSDSDQQSKDVRVDGDSGRRDASGHSNRHERDDDDRTKRNKDGGSDSYRDKESRERKIERYEEDREGRKHHEGSRHGRDDGDYRKRGSEPRLDKKDEDIRRYEGERHAARSGRDDDEHRRRSKDHDKGIKNERGYRDDKR